MTHRLCVLLLALAAPAFAITGTTTTLSITSNGSPVTSVNIGAVVTLTATVKAGTTAATPGQVNFCDATTTYCTDVHLFGTAQVTSAGTAILRFVPPVGTHAYKAVFAGTNTYAGSSSSDVSLTVNFVGTSGKKSTATVTTLSGTQGDYTLTATVTGDAASAQPGPTGTVSFVNTSNSNAVVASAVLGASEIGARWQIGPQTPPTDRYPQTIAVGDFNGDGIPDLAVGCDDESIGFVNHSVTILLGNGDGTFTPVGSIAVGKDPYQIVVGDFNSDGNLDLAVANAFDTIVTILLGNGDGTFTAAPSSISVTSPNVLAVGDFNGDGIPDLAIVGGGSLSIFLGNGDGTFTEKTPAPTTPPNVYNVAAGDFNGDGKIDIAISGYSSSSRSDFLTTLLSNGDGTFTPSTIVTDIGSVGQMVVADFNRDGKLDVLGGGGPYTSQLLLGNGDGTFQAQSYPFSSVGYMTLGDFNDDGNPDIILNYYSPTLWLNNGAGVFTSTPMNGVTAPYFALTAGDFNRDGLPDLVTFGYLASLNVFLTQPTQTAIATATAVSPSGSGAQLIAASYPGDPNFNASLSPTVSALGSSPTATLTTTSLSWFQAVGISSGSEVVYVSNNGLLPLQIKSIKLGGTNPSVFATSNTCGTTLAVGAQCRIGVRFIPPAANTYTATITLTDNAANSPQVIALNGTGYIPAAPELTFSATLVIFEDQAVSTSSATQTILVTNGSSGGPAYFGPYSFLPGGANPSSFVASSTCGTYLSPGGSCRIGMRFVPTTTGPLTATLTLTDNATGSPQVITLKGTGK